MNHNKEWKNGKLPVTISGIFDVKILSGLFLPLNLCYKIWQKEISAWKGSNIQDNKIYGYFIINRIQKQFLIDYSPSVNNWIWRRTFSRIKEINSDEYIGKIFFRFFGEYRFCGFFSLKRRM